MFKIAIVGTGIIGLSHIEALRKTEGAELVALCDVDEGKVKPLAEANGVPYFLDYHDIPRGVECDAVILNLPHGLHCESTVFFLDSGINVLVEKPMANTTTECDEMIAAARRSGKKLAVAHPQRYYTAEERIREIIDSGELGRLCMTTEQRSINYFNDSRPRWFLSKKAAGGGIVMNYGAHALDKLQYATGARMTKVWSNCQNFKNDYDIEGHAQIFGTLSNGASFSICFSGYTAAVYENYYYFTNGVLRSMGAETLEIRRGDGSWQDLGCHADGNEIARELAQFVKLLRGEEANIPSAEYSRDIIAAIEKIYENTVI